MRPDLELRLIAAEVVSESSLSKEAKIQLLNFIQYEATIPQIKVLLMDGKVSMLDEHAEQIAEDRWNALLSESKAKQLAKAAYYGEKALKQAEKGPGILGWRQYRSIRNLRKSGEHAVKGGVKQVKGSVKILKKAEKSALKKASAKTGAVVAGYGALSYASARRICKKKFPNDIEAYKKCMRGAMHKSKKK